MPRFYHYITLGILLEWFKEFVYHIKNGNMAEARHKCGYLFFCGMESFCDGIGRVIICKMHYDTLKRVFS